MTGKILLKVIGLLFYLLFRHVTLVQGNGKTLNTINKEDIDTLLHRLHSFPGHLKWNFFHPIQSRRNSELPTDMKFSNSTRSREESFSHDLQHGRLRPAEPFITEHKQINDLGKAGISQGAQIKVPTNLLIALLELLAENKKRQELVSEISQHATLTDDNTPLNADFSLSGKSKLSLAGHPKSDLRNNNWIQNEMKASGQNELFAEGQLKIPTHVLIAEIEKLLKAKQKGDNTTRENSANSETKERIHVSIPSQPRSVRRMEPIILKPVETGHYTPSESIISSPSNKLNLSRPVFKEHRSMSNRSVSLSQVKQNLPSINPNIKPMNDQGRTFPAEQKLELLDEAQQDASARGNLTVEGQIEVPTKLLLNAKNTYYPVSQKSVADLRVHDNRFHTTKNKLRDNTIYIQPNNADGGRNNESQELQFDSSGTANVIIEGQIEVPKHILDTAKKSLHDSASEKVNKHTSLSNNQNTATDVREHLLQHIHEKVSHEINLDSTGTYSNTTEGQVEIQSLSPGASLRTIYTAPGLGKMYNAVNINQSKQFSADNLKQSLITEKQISNKVNIDSTGRGEFIVEGQVEVPTHLLRNPHDKLFVALGLAQKERLPSKTLPTERQKQNTFKNPAKGVSNHLAGRSNSMLHRKSQLHQQNQYLKANRAHDRPGYNNRGISTHTHLDLSGTADVTIEGQVEVPLQFLEPPESTFTPFEQPTNLHNSHVDTIRANTKNNAGFDKSLGPGRIANARQSQLDVTGSSGVRTEGQIHGPSGFLHMANSNKNSNAKNKRLKTFPGKGQTFYEDQNNFLGQTQLDASGSGDFVFEGQIEIPSSYTHNSRGKLHSILSKTKQKQSWLNSRKGKQNVNNNSHLQNSKQHYLDAAGNAGVTIEGQVEIQNRLVKTPGSKLNAHRQRSYMHVPNMKSISPRTQSSDGFDKLLRQGQIDNIRQMQLESAGSSDFTTTGETQRQSRYTHMEETRKNDIAKNNVIPGKRVPFNQGHTDTVRQVQLDASGRGDLLIEGQIEVPSSLLLGTKRNGIASLGYRNQNHYSELSVPRRQHRNSKKRSQKSKRSHLYASGMGDITIEGQLEIPTSVLKSIDTTEPPRNQPFNIHNREYRDKNGHVFRRLSISKYNLMIY